MESIWELNFFSAVPFARLIHFCSKANVQRQYCDIHVVYGKELVASVYGFSSSTIAGCNFFSISWGNVQKLGKLRIKDIHKEFGQQIVITTMPDKVMAAWAASIIRAL